MIRARVDWDGPWSGPLAPDLHGVDPSSWSVRYLEGSPRQLRRAMAYSHRLRAFGLPAPRPLGLLRQGAHARLLYSDDADPLPSKIERAQAQSLGALLSLLAQQRIRVPRLHWTSLGQRAGEVVPLDLRGAHRTWRSPTRAHLGQLARDDLPPRTVLAGLRAAAMGRPDPKSWARQWWWALARGETRSPAE